MKYYTTKEIADLIQMHERTIVNHLNRGLLKGNKFGGRWRISQEELDDYLKNGTTEKEEE